MRTKSVEKLLILLKEKALSTWGKALLCFNPNQLLDHNVSGILIFMLFPNIFIFLSASCMSTPVRDKVLLRIVLIA